MDFSAEDVNQITRPHYVHDELCVVVSGNIDGDQKDYLAIYIGVLDWLNERIGHQLPPPADVTAGEAPAGSDAAATFARDLAPLRSDVWRRLRGLKAILKPLARPNIVVTQPQPDPGTPGVLMGWVLLDRGGARSKALCFYQIDLEPSDRDLLPSERAKTVRTLVNVINRSLRPVSIPVGGHTTRSIRIDAATPHWMASAGQTSCPVVTGPASLPMRAPAPPLPAGAEQASQGEQAPRMTWSFDVGDLPLGQQSQSGVQTAGSNDPTPGQGVVVAILDTSPTQEAVGEAAKRYPDNWLLNQVFASVKFEQPPSFRPDHFAPHLDRYLPYWHKETARVSAAGQIDHFAIPDHGLFVAGIIRDVAPGAEIHLIRTSNDYGVSDVHTIAHTLRELVRTYRPENERARPLIVNMSSMFAVPATQHLLAHWFPRSFNALPVVRSWLGDIVVAITDLHSGLFELFDWLNEQGVLVVAAAGNDAQREEPLRPEPRAPARYGTELENVVGAGSIGMSGRPSEFSNRANVFWGGSGLAAFGGNAQLTPDGAPEIVTYDGEPDAVIGIMSCKELPLNGGPNDTGWAYWAGTSFSTAVISGLAARTWASDANLPAPAVVDQLRSCAMRSESALECSAIQLRQKTDSRLKP